MPVVLCVYRTVRTAPCQGRSLGGPRGRLGRAICASPPPARPHGPSTYDGAFIQVERILLRYQPDRRSAQTTNVRGRSPRTRATRQRRRAPVEKCSAGTLLHRWHPRSRARGGRRRARQGVPRRIARAGERAGTRDAGGTVRVSDRPNRPLPRPQPRRAAWAAGASDFRLARPLARPARHTPTEGTPTEGS